MRFHEEQARRRRNSAFLVLLFAAAVAGTILALHVSLSLALRLLGAYQAVPFIERPERNPLLFGAVVAGTVVFLLAGSLSMRRRLADGGGAVAERLGGGLLPLDPFEVGERRLRNVVEEMAVASGVPVPEIYVLDREEGVNALSAGYRLDDAAVAATRGALENLSRDELQAVVAHEMAHLVHGDTRQRTHLLGVLHGVRLLGSTGRFLLTGNLRAASAPLRHPIAAFLVGGTLATVGSVGLFFSRLLQRAVCREREYLADAAAVRFTRNPRALSAALRKIGGIAGRSRIRNARADEARHFFFADGIRPLSRSLLGTHPPLERRIARVEPGFTGAIPRVRSKSAERSFLETFDPEHRRHRTRLAALPAEAVARHVESFAPAEVALAGAFLEAIPPAIARALRDPDEAKALAYALLLDSHREGRAGQLPRLRERLDPASLSRVLHLRAEADRLGPGARLPLLDLSLPSLRRLPREEKDRLLEDVGPLADADGRVTLFEFVLGLLVRLHLGGRRPEGRGGASGVFSLRPFRSDAFVLLSALAYAGHADPRQAATAFAAGAAKIDPREAPLLLRLEDCVFSAVERALARIADAPPGIRRRILLAGAAVVAHDGEVTLEEAELLRALGESFDCPVAPFFGKKGSGTVSPERETEPDPLHSPH